MTAHIEHQAEQARSVWNPVARPLPATAPFPPLEAETRANVPTDCAAYHLNRRPQTLRAWACLENGPLRPVRLYGRLGWPVSELRRLTAGAK